MFLAVSRPGSSQAAAALLLEHIIEGGLLVAAEHLDRSALARLLDAVLQVGRVRGEGGDAVVVLLDAAQRDSSQQPVALEIVNKN